MYAEQTPGTFTMNQKLSLDIDGHLDIGNSYNGMGQFVCNTNGTYLFVTSVRKYSNYDSRFEAAINQNGEVRARLLTVVSASRPTHAYGACIVHCIAGDVVDVTVTGLEADKSSAKTAGDYFAGFMLFADPLPPRSVSITLKKSLSSARGQNSINILVMNAIFFYGLRIIFYL